MQDAVIIRLHIKSDEIKCRVFVKKMCDFFIHIGITQIYTIGIQTLINCLSIDRRTALL